MVFQFTCPHGHLLEGEESQAGQRSQCPQCGTVFVVPSPQMAGAASHGHFPGQSESFPGVGFQFPAAPGPAESAQPFAGLGAGVAAGGAMPGAPEGPRLLHIPCPNGHELETPPEMLDQEVMCPHCGAQFRLREKDSVEYKRRRDEELEQKYRRAGRLWFNWAVGIAIFVAIGLVALAVWSVYGIAQ
jgi:DNA-directed RNA polymerase subunit RPC12/RpoP